MAVKSNKINGMNIAPKASVSLPAERPNFGIATNPTNGNNGLIQIQQTRELSQVMAEVMMAKNFPRNPSTALRDLESACGRQSLAEHSTYQYARGGSNITGPTIRLAEQIARSWGNIKYGFNILDESDSASVVQAYAYDIETNTRAERQFVVKHIRGTKAGNKDVSDPRDIYELCANSASRRVRACILQVIPSDVVDYAVSLCDKTLSSSVKITPETISSLLSYYKDKYGVTEEQIAKRIQRNVSSITVEKYLELKRIAESLKDGMSTPEDWFDTDAAPAPEAPKKVPEQAPIAIEESAQPETEDVLFEDNLEGDQDAESFGF